MFSRYDSLSMQLALHHGQLCVTTSVLVCSEDAEIIACAPCFHSFLRAVTKNYPVSGFLQPSYAATMLTQLIDQNQPISASDATTMQCAFPQLHQVVNTRGWSTIPDAWKPFLKHLILCACGPRAAPQVSDHNKALSCY